MSKQIAKRVREEDFSKAAHRYYEQYATATIEDRAVPAELDGLKPVIRRSMWAAYKMGARSTAQHIKSARLVGETLGKYHPHGDQACYEAIVNYSRGRCVFPLFDGGGNFGSFSNSDFASMRYTQTRLHAIAEAALFDPHYLPITELVSNYDGTEQEPVVLPALLPIALMNSKLGLAPGVRLLVPEFSIESVIKAVRLRAKRKSAFNAKELIEILDPTTRYGGTANKKKQKAELLSLMENGSGRLVHDSHMAKAEHIKGHTRMIFDRFSLLDAAWLKTKIPLIKGVKSASNSSDKNDKYGTFTVTLAKSLDTDSSAAKRVIKAFSTATSYGIFVTEREIEDDEVLTQLRKRGTIHIFENWYQHRLEIERKASLYWQKECDKEIRKLEVLKMAVEWIDIIFKGVKSNYENDKLYEWFRKQVKNKVTLEETQYLFGIPVINLRKLEKKKLDERIAKFVARKKELKGWYEKPETRALDTADAILKLMPTVFKRSNVRKGGD